MTYYTTVEVNQQARNVKLKATVSLPSFPQSHHPSSFLCFVFPSVLSLPCPYCIIHFCLSCYCLNTNRPLNELLPQAHNLIVDCEGQAVCCTTASPAAFVALQFPHFWFVRLLRCDHFQEYENVAAGHSLP